MSKHGRTGLCLLVLMLSACAPVGIAGRELTFPGNRSTRIEGQIIEARCYLTTSSVAADHTYCAFRSARGNLPLGLLTDDGHLLFLTEAPSRLADLVTQRVRVRGLATANKQLLQPQVIEVLRNGSWAKVAL